jgi:C1A family cysteine protease
LTKDGGAFGRDGARLLLHTGVCSESAFPYTHHNMVTKPPQAAYDEAAKHKITAYKHVYSLEGLLDALASGHLVPFGFEVPESFESDETARTGVLRMPKPGEKSVGGHEVVAAGYDMDAQVVFCLNSWGEKWGMHLKLSDGVEHGGIFTMPFAFAASRKLCDDFIVLQA